MFDSELDQFKAAIDLRAYAAAQGFCLDRKESYRGSAVMRHPASNDKIIIKRELDGHYLWFSVRTNAGGTIIDFVRHLRRFNLGQIRIELRPWIGKPPVAVPEFPALVGTTKDRMKVAARFARMEDATSGHPYLERERGLPPSLLSHERFAGRIRGDARGNAALPHFDLDGLCGYELKGHGLTSFASGGTKALWLSREFDDDLRLVFCESAIDALSFAALFGEARTRFASIGGKPNPQQPALIRAAIERLPDGSEVTAAMDADEDGRKLAGVVREAFESARRDDLRFRVREPVGFKDFNDQLRGKVQMRHASPTLAAEPR
jgi:Toprim-like/Protein of unknown function (DUF3991)